ncbi:MAG TPA: PHP domain-containing protein [Steroidobacteraceae bacterium]|nr:PHP domain-containing protein [Steroidobacteraceae bacterium]
MNEAAAGPLGRIDLHTHSCCSDGTLRPAELVQLAAARGVTLLALTDHDTLAGLPEAQLACAQHGIQFVPGVELSCHWQEVEIHVLGLGIDASANSLRSLCGEQRQRRQQRIEAIGKRLSALGMPGSALAEKALQAAAPTRAHLAEGIRARGFVASAQEAFDRYLAGGRPAFVSAPWPALATILQHILEARGLAVLAHPHRYGLSGTRLGALTQEFKRLGGAGIEISVAGMSPAKSAEAARLARRFDLAGSLGSDFHQPGIPWRPLGRLVKLPEAVTPITARLAQAHGPHH